MIEVMVFGIFIAECYFALLLGRHSASIERINERLDGMDDNYLEFIKLSSKVDILQGRIDEMEEGYYDDILLERIEGLEKYLKIEGEYTEPEASKLIYKKK